MIPSQNRYIIVGASNTIFGFIPFSLGYWWFGQLYVFEISLVGNLISCIFSYLNYAKFVFPEVKISVSGFISYVSMNFFFVISTPFLMKYLVNDFSVNGFLAQLIIAFIVVITTALVNFKIIYKPGDS